VKHGPRPHDLPRSSAPAGRRSDLTDRLAETWEAFWFTAVDPRPLAVVRVLTAFVGMALWWSYADDLMAWFGPGGMIPVETAAAWRPAAGFSLYDFLTTSSSVQALFGATACGFLLLASGWAAPAGAAVSAVLWASLLNRGPMLAGPADDCLMVILWCLVVAPVAPSVARGLLQVHASVIAAATALAQLKGDVWWNGTAAWWLAARTARPGLDLTGPLRGSEYLVNLLTHGITAFELLFAAGLWVTATRGLVARAGLVAWPLVGLLGGEPWWGVAMAIFCVPFLGLPRRPIAG
jgi:hypothetical protein